MSNCQCKKKTLRCRGGSKKKPRRRQQCDGDGDGNGDEEISSMPVYDLCMDEEADVITFYRFSNSF